MDIEKWWNEQPAWFKILLTVIAWILIGVLSNYIPNLAGRFYYVLGEQGICIIILISIIVFVSQKYILDKVNNKLEVISDIMLKIAEKVGVELRERVNSPGFVYLTCRWLRISKEIPRNGVYDIYVYCAHPQKPMTPDGCPRNCPYLDTSDKTTGSGAFTGLILGGLLGSVLGGAAGAILGGILGAVVGDSLERAKSVYMRISELRKRGIQYQIHIDENFIR